MATFIYFILVFGIIIFFHEFGHFMTAKLSGVLVHEFSLGMGPKILKHKGKETTYSIGAFPIGGYVKMEGEDEDSENRGSFSSKPPWKRFAIILAGPLMNFMLALLIFTILFLYIGMPTTVVGETMEGFPAEVGGLRAGDRILAVNDEFVDSWNDIVTGVSKNRERVDLTIERDREEVPVSIVPVEDNGRMMIGIIPELKRNVFYAFGMAADRVWFVSTNIFSFLSDLFRGQELQGEIVGPIGIYSMVSEASKYSFVSVLSLAAVISINLGIVNLLPFPALDGGRLVFILIEMAKGSPIDKEKEGLVHFIGFVLLMALMVYMVVKDLGRMNVF